MRTFLAFVSLGTLLACSKPGPPEPPHLTRISHVLEDHLCVTHAVSVSVKPGDWIDVILIDHHGRETAVYKKVFVEAIEHSIEADCVLFPISTDERREASAIYHRINRPYTVRLQKITKN